MKKLERTFILSIIALLSGITHGADSEALYTGNVGQINPTNPQVLTGNIQVSGITNSTKLTLDLVLPNGTQQTISNITISENGTYYGEAIFDAIGIAYDTIATLIPFLPGGASAALKAGRATKSFSTAYNTGVDFTKIAQHVDNFASKYTADAFSSSAVYGTKLHKYVSESLYSSYNRYSTNFYDFRALSQTKRGGPDFINKNNKIWMDITTPSSWGAHELKYTSGYGFGIGITYTRGVGVNSSRLTTGAGYLSGALSFK